MKSLREYLITEKLKINKDVKEDDVEFNFMDKYKD